MSPSNSFATNPHGPVGKGEYVVQQGDCIESIAQRHGLYWETIWNHSKNADLRQANREPNALLPGDRVFIPELRAKKEQVNTEVRHSFRRKGVPSLMRIVFKDEEDNARAGVRFVLKLDGGLVSGKTDNEGAVEFPIKPDACTGKLVLMDEDEQEEYEIQLGFIDPIGEVYGIQERLENLGFTCGPPDGELGPLTREALRSFQKAYGLKDTGEPDQQTLQTLESEHTG